jgi:leader peptidase (prepilin peptidase)/N-methyltransferase
MNPPPPALAELFWSPDLFYIWAGFAMVFGLLWGSFLNVVIYRVPMGLSVNNPRRSFCFRCGSTIRATENLPVISWLLQRGRCRHCGSRISGRYAFVELLTGLLFLAVFLAVNDPAEPFRWATLWYAAFIAMMVVATFTDIDHWIIPQRLTDVGMLVALACALAIGFLDADSILTEGGPFPAVLGTPDKTFFGFLEAILAGPDRYQQAMRWWAPLANGILGAATGMGILKGIAVIGRVVFQREAMGMGDVWLFGLVGATVGPLGVVMVLVISSFIGSVVGVAGKVRGMLAPAPERPLDRVKALLPEPEPGAEPPAADSYEAHARASLTTPPPRPMHPLPYGPSIAMAAVIYILANDAIMAGIRAWMFPGWR